MSTGGYGLLYENTVSRRGRRWACRQLLMARRRRNLCPDVGNGDAVEIASPLRDLFEEWKRGGGGT